MANIKTQFPEHDMPKILDDLLTDITALKTSVDASNAANPALNNYLDYMSEDGVFGGDYTIAAAAAATLTGAGRIKYRINGVEYERALDTTLTMTNNTTEIATTKWGAFRYYLGRATIAVPPRS